VIRHTFGGQRPAPKALKLQRLQALRTTANIAGGPAGILEDSSYARVKVRHAASLSLSRKWARRRPLQSFDNVHLMDRPRVQWPNPGKDPSANPSPLAYLKTYDGYLTDSQALAGQDKAMGYELFTWSIKQPTPPRPAELTPVRKWIARMRYAQWKRRARWPAKR